MRENNDKLQWTKWPEGLPGPNQYSYIVKTSACQFLAEVDVFGECDRGWVRKKMPDN